MQVQRAGFVHKLRRTTGAEEEYVDDFEEEMGPVKEVLL